MKTQKESSSTSNAPAGPSSTSSPTSDRALGASPSSTSNTTSTPTSKPKPIKTLYEQLKTTENDILTTALVSAVLEGRAFPESMKKIRSIQTAYLENRSNPKSKEHLVNSVELYFAAEGCAEIKRLLRTDSPFALNPGLIESLRASLGLKIEPTNLVEGKIVDGKVFWRTISPVTGQPRANSPKSKKSSIFDYDEATCFRMTPAQWEEFKPAGNRSSNAEITRSTFLKSCELATKYHTEFGKIWDELKQLGIFDQRNRLSKNWRNLFNKYVTLKSYEPHIIRYSLIADLLTQLANQGQRKERSPKQWEDQKVSFQPRTNETETKCWDVGTLGELTHFNWDNNVTFAHFPSLETLEQFKFLSEETDTETASDWMALAIPTNLVDPKKSDLSTITGLLSVTTTPKQVGAVRRLFRDSVKEYPPVAGISSIGRTSSEFWKVAPVAKEEVSLEITEKVNSLSAQL